MVTLLQLDASIENVTSLLASLRKLMQSINTNHVYFDLEDKKIIVAKIEALKINYSQLQRSKIKHLEACIAIRTGIFEQPNVTAAFTQFPDMLQFFAHKQSKLQQYLDNTKQQLLPETD